jgi:rubrerythrin
VEPEQRSGAGEWLARLATVEAASVTAFVRLARALERLSAPRSMIAAARRAIADEIVHARIVARLARSHGASPQNPEISEQAEPSLAQLAHENAVEGQVAETFGALIATCQAQHATDPEIRAVFSKIARDEARHAALAHRLAPWLERQLAPDERAAVVDARRSAVAAIAQSGDLGLSAADRELLGVPAPDRLRVAAAATFAALA